MATAIDKFPGTNLEKLLSLLEEDDFSDEDFGVDLIEFSVTQRSDWEGFNCKHCTKILKSERNLIRHISTNHPSQHQEATDEATSNILNRLRLKKIISDFARKLSEEFCYPEDVRNLFCVFSFS